MNTTLIKGILNFKEFNPDGFYKKAGIFIPAFYVLQYGSKGR